MTVEMHKPGLPPVPTLKTGSSTVAASGGIRIRPAVEADLAAILDIYNEAVLNTTASYDYEPRTLDQRVSWFRDHETHGYPVFVAVADDGRIVGWSSLNRYHDRKGYQFTTENSVYVAAGERGHGVGRRLLGPLIEAARERGGH